MKREDVYKILDEERDYQDGKWNHVDHKGKSPTELNSVGDFITYMDHYFMKAKQNYTTNSGNKQALDALRKMVSLGVACFEQHGVTDREF